MLRFDSSDVLMIDVSKKFLRTIAAVKSFVHQFCNDRLSHSQLLKVPIVEYQGRR